MSFEAATVKQGPKAIERPETRRRKHVPLSEEYCFLRCQSTIRELAHVSVELVEQIFES